MLSTNILPVLRVIFNLLLNNLSTIFSLTQLMKLNLQSDSHVPENFGQIKIFLSHVRKNTIICLFGV